METTAVDKKMMEESRRISYPKVIKVWLAIGVFMVFMQVVIGGITRLTGSGLSITKWEIVTGTLPPLNAAAWEEAFDEYKATPQYEQINEGMSMGEFKFIYFWEYFHRLWARTMGFVFAIPFFYFLSKGWIDKMLKRRLLIVVALAAVVASFGWIMVASGLIERPWVNAYKLTMHLSLALVLFSYLLWTTFKVFQPYSQVINSKFLKKGAFILISVLALQIVLGGIMSGMKAALFYPTWPDLNGEYLPEVLLESANWNVENFVNYDKTSFMSALVQILHRTTAYLLVIIGLIYFGRGIKMELPKMFKISLFLMLGMLIIQVALGIFTVINSKASIPVDLGVYHQAGALLLLGVVLFLNFQLVNRPETSRCG